MTIDANYRLVAPKFFAEILQQKSRIYDKNHISYDPKRKDDWHFILVYRVYLRMRDYHILTHSYNARISKPVVRNLYDRMSLYYDKIITVFFCYVLNLK